METRLAEHGEGSHLRRKWSYALITTSVCVDVHKRFDYLRNGTPPTPPARLYFSTPPQTTPAPHHCLFTTFFIKTNPNKHTSKKETVQSMTWNLKTI